MSFGFNDGSGKPLTVARQSLLALGQRLGIESRAVNHRRSSTALCRTRVSACKATPGNRCCCFR